MSDAQLPAQPVAFNVLGEVTLKGLTKAELRGLIEEAGTAPTVLDLAKVRLTLARRRLDRWMLGIPKDARSPRFWPVFCLARRHRDRLAAEVQIRAFNVDRLLCGIERDHRAWLAAQAQARSPATDTPPATPPAGDA